MHSACKCACAMRVCACLCAVFVAGVPSGSVIYSSVAPLVLIRGSESQRRSSLGLSELYILPLK